MTTEEFITRNLDADVRTLALRHAGRTDIDINYALDQISGRQTARKKLPQWAATDGIIYPPHISMEQCSSEQTATYKAAVARRLLKSLHPTPVLPALPVLPANPHPPTLIDLTGGFGVDFSYLAPMFARAVYIERQEHLCSVARHNMAALGITQAEIICGDSTQIIASTGHATMVFADPARRDAHGGRTFAISDCTPDVLAMKDMLLDKADFAMVKLSPMLDWHKAVADMGSCIGEVHIVSVGNECKELLLVMSRRYNGLERIFCVNDGQSFSFAPQPHNPTTVKPHNPTTAKPHNPTTANFLYEPNASIMKAGCFALLEQEYGASQLSRDSHLFISDEKITSFPGRGFAITAITTMNKKELKTALAGIDRANVSTRNFPLTADALRRKLRLKDGGNTYIFGTTAEDGKHILIIADKQTSRQADEQTSKRVDKQASKSNLLVYSSACLLVC